MQAYKTFRPTACDAPGLAADTYDIGDWLVSLGTNRDACALTRSNFRVHQRDLERLDPNGEDHQVHRFGHWANGWFELILVRPGTACAEDAKSTESALADYPVLDESDFSELEQEEANATWLNCYKPSERLEYIRDNRNQFSFHDWQDLLANVRGTYFSGHASEMCGS